MTVDQIIQLIVAIGTIVVAVLAIWGERIKQILGLGPKLVLTLHDPQGELIDVTGNGKLRYYHLKVSNIHRWTQATNTRIVIIELSRPAADGTWATQGMIGPLQLVWRFTNFHPLYSIVGPDDICDLGHVSPEGNFTLTTYLSPNNFVGTLEGGQRMTVLVKAIADNAESRPLALEICWDGKWSEDTLAMASHMVIKKA